MTTLCNSRAISFTLVLSAVIYIHELYNVNQNIGQTKTDY